MAVSPPRCVYAHGNASQGLIESSPVIVANNSIKKYSNLRTRGGALNGTDWRKPRSNNGYCPKWPLFITIFGWVGGDCFGFGEKPRVTWLRFNFLKRVNFKGKVSVWKTRDVSCLWSGTKLAGTMSEVNFAFHIRRHFSISSTLEDPEGPKFWQRWYN